MQECRLLFSQKSLASRMDAALEKIRSGRIATEIAKKIGITQQAVQKWRRVPATRVLAVAPILEMTPEEIRPDVFAPDHGIRKRKHGTTRLDRSRARNS
jgi:DNA-binding transcriptional regulator YdaS (Cro superfamily)